MKKRQSYYEPKNNMGRARCEKTKYGKNRKQKIVTKGEKTKKIKLVEEGKTEQKPMEE